MNEMIDYEARGGTALIRINRPEKRNALTASMCEALRGAFERLRDGQERVGILYAEGSTFCGGADLTMPPERFWQAIPDLGVDIGKPVIAAVQGPVVGLGVTIVAFCDLCVAADDTRFIYPEARVGISKGLISALSARVPHKIAMELMLTGGPITAQRAYDTGFINRVTPPGGQLQGALELAATMVDAAPLVLAQLKALSRQTLPTSPVEAFYRTASLVDTVLNSEDAAEGLQAFRDKRAPVFRGV